MANQGAKKRFEENRRKLQVFRLAILVGIVCYGTVRMFLFKGHRSGWQWAGFVLTVVLELLAYSLLSSMAAPIFGDNNELEYGGAEIGKLGSISSYYQDLLYISVFVQVAGSFWLYFWLAYLAVPGYAGYLLLTKVIIPYFSQPSEPEMVMDEATRKKLEKTEARARRRQMKWR